MCLFVISAIFHLILAWDVGLNMPVSDRFQFFADHQTGFFSSLVHERGTKWCNIIMV